MPSSKKDPLNAPHMQLNYANRWLNRVKKDQTVKVKKITKRALTKKQKPGCRARGRALGSCFKDGEKIRHKGKCDSTWEATYNNKIGKLVHDGYVYTTLSTFSRDHYTSEGKRMKAVGTRGKKKGVHFNNSEIGRGGVNGWEECEVFRNGEWVSTFSLNALP